MRGRLGLLLGGLVSGGWALAELRPVEPEVVRCAELPQRTPRAGQVRLEDCRADPVGALALTRAWRAHLNAEVRRLGESRVVTSGEVFLPYRALGAASDTPPVAVVRTRAPLLVSLVEQLGRPGAPPPEEVLASFAARHPELLKRWGHGHALTAGHAWGPQAQRAREALGAAVHPGALLLEEGVRPDATRGVLLLALSMLCLGLLVVRLRPPRRARLPQEGRPEAALELGQLAALRREERRP
jgi:hypothetical protein